MKFIPSILILQLVGFYDSDCKNNFKLEIEMNKFVLEKARIFMFKIIIYENKKNIIMIKEKDTRKKIIRRIEKISSDKLEELLKFINKIDNKKSAKNKILSLAGAWENIDNSVFDDFTKNLILKREQNLRRFNG